MSTNLSALQLTSTYCFQLRSFENWSKYFLCELNIRDSKLLFLHLPLLIWNSNYLVLGSSNNILIETNMNNSSDLIILQYCKIIFRFSYVMLVVSPWVLVLSEHLKWALFIIWRFCFITCLSNLCLYLGPDWPNWSTYGVTWYFCFGIFKLLGCTEEQLVSPIASLQNVPGFETQQSSYDLPMHAKVVLRYFGFLPQSKTTHIRLIWFRL